MSSSKIAVTTLWVGITPSALIKIKDSRIEAAYYNGHQPILVGGTALHLITGFPYTPRFGLGIKVWSFTSEETGSISMTKLVPECAAALANIIPALNALGLERPERFVDTFFLTWQPQND